MTKKVYVVAGRVPNRSNYLTAGKKYLIIRENDMGCDIIDDQGDELNLCFTGCFFLSGEDWTRIEEPDTDELLRDDAQALLEALEMFVNNSSIQTGYPDYCEYAEKLISKHRSVS